MAVVQGEFWTDTFLKATGAPYSGVRVYHYAAGTSTAKSVWSDGPMVTPAAQPVVGDNSGRALFYGDGDYRLVVKSSVADGDLTLYDWDVVKLTAKAATLRGENQATSYPAATSANRGQLFAKIDGSGNVVDLGIQKDTAFASVVFANSTPSGTINFAKGADLASGSTLNIGTDGNFFDVIGGVTIESLGVRAAGTTIWLRFLQALNLTHNATSLILPYGVPYRTIPNEMICVVSLGSGNWILAWRSGPTTAPGDMSDTGAATAADGHVVCDGSVLLRATYPGAFERVGTTYGAGLGDGLTFNAPNRCGRVGVGVGTGVGGGASGTGLPVGGATLQAVARGQWKGEDTHLLTGPESGVAAHLHSITDVQHDHAEMADQSSAGGADKPTAVSQFAVVDTGVRTGASFTGITDTNTTGPIAAGSPHNIIQPVLGVNVQMRV